MVVWPMGNQRTSEWPCGRVAPWGTRNLALECSVDGTLHRIAMVATIGKAVTDWTRSAAVLFIIQYGRNPPRVPLLWNPSEVKFQRG